MREGPKHAIVNSSELGTDCWLPQRFVRGGRCQRIESCKYPEKKTCEAVQAELDYLARKIIQIGQTAVEQQKMIGQAMERLMRERKK